MFQVSKFALYPTLKQCDEAVEALLKKYPVLRKTSKEMWKNWLRYKFQNRRRWRFKEETEVPNSVKSKRRGEWIQVMTPRKKMYVVVPNLPGTPQSFKLDFSCYYTNIRISRPHMNANNLTYKINIKNLVTRKICIIMAYCFRRKAVGYLLNLKCYLLHKLLWRKSSIKFLLLDEKFVECFFSAFQDWLFCSARYHNSI